jgi:hypothetical protein
MKSLRSVAGYTRIDKKRNKEILTSLIKRKAIPVTGREGQ